MLNVYFHAQSRKLLNVQDAIRCYYILYCLLITVDFNYR